MSDGDDCAPPVLFAYDLQLVYFHLLVYVWMKSREKNDMFTAAGYAGFAFRYQSSAFSMINFLTTNVSSIFSFHSRFRFSLVSAGWSRLRRRPHPSQRLQQQRQPPSPQQQPPRITSSRHPIRS